MPHVHIRITREGASAEAKRELIAGGRYDVIGMSTADGRTLVQLQFAGPVTGR